MRLLLVTHAETDWNALGRFQGHSDVALNERGRQQAQGLQERLAHATLHAIVSSDLRRARETAEIVAVPHGLSVACDRRLRELSFGGWEGLTYAELERLAPRELAAWTQDPLQVSPPGGERLTDLAERLQTFLEDRIDANSDQALLVVAHRGSLRALLCLLLGVPVIRHWEFRLEPASVTEVSLVDGRAILVPANEGCGS